MVTDVDVRGKRSKIDECLGTKMDRKGIKNQEGQARKKRKNQEMDLDDGR
jgi:hypothetical protein